ncbi:hypothetical protein SLEP1_g23932 [Rubroshorea leprosula]|uniref:Uncharacterized protein n=1 Tax=Rubroshorea leprosula TaxID=152421 RepID=A0AAV5JJZ2_9ROSI|nr:hypothetical protein SLEP1_g23932 [Rubroshorea leprosula]
MEEGRGRRKKGEWRKTKRKERGRKKKRSVWLLTKMDSVLGCHGSRPRGGFYEPQRSKAHSFGTQTGGEVLRVIDVGKFQIYRVRFFSKGKKLGEYIPFLPFRQGRKCRHILYFLTIFCELNGITSGSKLFYLCSLVH